MFKTSRCGLRLERSDKRMAMYGPNGSGNRFVCYFDQLQEEAYVHEVDEAIPSDSKWGDQYKLQQDKQGKEDHWVFSFRRIS